MQASPSLLTRDLHFMHYHYSLIFYRLVIVPAGNFKHSLLYLTMYRMLIGLLLASLSLYAQHPDTNYLLLRKHPAITADSGRLLIRTFSPEALQPFLRDNRLIKQLSPTAAIIQTNKHYSLQQGQIDAAGNYFKASDNLLSLINSDRGTLIQVMIARKSLSGYTKEIRNLTSTQIDTLLNQEDIQFIDLVRKPATELITELDIPVNSSGAFHHYFPDVKGENNLVVIKEDKFDTADIDISGRANLSQLASSQSSVHASMMATIIAGNGNSYIRGNGIAPSSSLVSTDYNNLSPDNITLLGSRIQNHSYGVGIENYYGIEASEYDAQIYQEDTLLHIFSAGNSGDEIPQSGTYTGVGRFANLTGTFKQAKNILTVGAVNAEYEVENFSSNGPSYDGRIKPELVAGGVDGTSGAAAACTGIGTLLSQLYYQFNHTAPSAALIKSILISSASNVGGISYKTGFGNINALDAGKIIQQKQYLNGEVSAGNTKKYSLNIPANTHKVKVTLAWNDPPAAINAPYALVNDLDLYVTSNNGDTIRPWVLSSFPQADSLSRAALRGIDSINNVEQVTLELPAAGNYDMHVLGRKINMLQKFALSWQLYSENGFEWTYPLSDDQLFSNSYTYIRWNTTLSGKATLQYSLDEGKSWQFVTDTINIAKGYYLWTTPPTFSTAILKLTINNTDKLSPVFSISSHPVLSVGYLCQDENQLYWPRIPLASSYTVYHLSDHLLIPYKTVTDTFVTIPSADMNTPYWAVSAITPKCEGIKSPTIDIQKQGVSCYLKTFTGVYDEETDQVKLALSLSGFQHLAKITCQKIISLNQVKEIGVIHEPDNCCYSFTDPVPSDGRNKYRVLLETQEGLTFPFPLDVTVVRAGDIQLFPNPVSTDINILCGSNNDYILSLYTSSGSLLLQNKINGYTNKISLAHLPSGILFYRITLHGKQIKAGKIIKIR
ncbi:S8 family serine peptidase [Chitinophaga polysaccharea]|uniref:S8 family serine peptidase n=1 Tax=Chitinophaga polysaccharea TaxID=1293035 RepID=UPI001158EC01|nr:S8 family serine peptidase [Chitinophaga polysaccharea]